MAISQVPSTINPGNLILYFGANGTPVDPNATGVVSLPANTLNFSPTYFTFLPYLTPPLNVTVGVRSGVSNFCPVCPSGPCPVTPTNFMPVWLQITLLIVLVLLLLGLIVFVILYFRKSNQDQYLVEERIPASQEEEEQKLVTEYLTTHEVSSNLVPGQVYNVNV